MRQHSGSGKKGYNPKAYRTVARRIIGVFCMPQETIAFCKWATKGWQELPLCAL